MLPVNITVKLYTSYLFWNITNMATLRITWIVSRKCNVYRISLGEFAKLRKATIGFIVLVRPSVRMNSSAPMGQIFMKFDTWVFFPREYDEKTHSLQSDKNNDTLHEDISIFVIISRWILIRMRSVSDKSCRENQKTRSLFRIVFPNNRTVYEIMWKSTVQPDRPQMTIRRMCIACWMTKATDTHSEHVILRAFPRQRWLSERASVSGCTFIVCLFLWWTVPVKHIVLMYTFSRTSAPKGWGPWSLSRHCPCFDMFRADLLICAL